MKPIDVTSSNVKTEEAYGYDTDEEDQKKDSEFIHDGCLRIPSVACPTIHSLSTFLPTREVNNYLASVSAEVVLSDGEDVVDLFELSKVNAKMFEDNKVVLIGKADDEVDATAEGNDKPLSPETRTGQKRKTEDTDDSGDSLQCFSDEQEVDNRSIADDPKKFAIFPKATIEYLNSWISQHVDDPFPDASEKATIMIMADTGLTKQQVGDWMARKRMKLRKKDNSTNKSDLRTLNTTKVENLLLAKGPYQNNDVPHSKSAAVAPGNEKP